MTIYRYAITGDNYVWTAYDIWVLQEDACTPKLLETKTEALREVNRARAAARDDPRPRERPRLLRIKASRVTLIFEDD